MWELNVQTRKITPTDCNLGQLKRIVNCIEVSEDDQYMYCGTTSGDVIQVRMPCMGGVLEKYSTIFGKQ